MEHFVTNIDDTALEIISMYRDGLDYGVFYYGADETIYRSRDLDFLYQSIH